VREGAGILRHVLGDADVYLSINAPPKIITSQTPALACWKLKKESRDNDLPGTKVDFPLLRWPKVGGYYKINLLQALETRKVVLIVTEFGVNSMQDLH